MAGEFSHGLFSCFDDCMLCLTTYFAPCYTLGKSAEAVGDDCLLCGLSFFVPILNFYAMCSNRAKIREQKGIPGSAVSDILTVCCCPLCSLVQQAQEMGVKAPFGQSMSRE
jgi:Cys-rich protein (TIGR01571 family)